MITLSTNFSTFATKLIDVRLLLFVLKAMMQMLAPQSPAQNGVSSMVAIDSQLALIPQRWPEVPCSGVIFTRRHSVIFPRGLVHRVENRWGLTKVAVVLLIGLIW